MLCSVAEPVRVAVLDDYEVVVQGVATMLRPHADRVVVVEVDAQEPLTRVVDVALLDSFAQGEADRIDPEGELAAGRAGHVAMYTWNLSDDLVHIARDRGFSGCLSKRMAADELVAAIERIASGEFVIAEAHSRERGERDYPGRAVGLTERQAEVLALVTQGFTNAEICSVLHLSRDGLKSRIRAAYRTIGARRRVDAVLWGTRNGFVPLRRPSGDVTQQVLSQATVAAALPDITR